MMNRQLKTAARTLALLVLMSGLTGCFDKSAPKIAFKTIEGTTLTPADYAGKVVFVNFWATSCTTCVQEMPGVVDTYNQFKGRGFKTIAVAMSYDRPDYVVNFAKTRNLPFDVALDLDGSAAKAYNNVQVTPTSYLLDKKGNIIKTYVGQPDFKALHALIDQALSDKG